MADLRVSCVSKFPRKNPYEGITHLGGVDWRLTRQEVIQLIEQRIDIFYTQVDGRRATVGVIEGLHGKYLRTHSDGEWDDNLLALPECH